MYTLRICLSMRAFVPTGVLQCCSCVFCILMAHALLYMKALGSNLMARAL